MRVRSCSLNVSRTMSDYEVFDLKAYRTLVQNGPCFICNIVAGQDKTHHIVYKDEVAIAFLNKYPTLYGYLLVAPIEHREQVTGDFPLDEYLRLQKVVYNMAEALRQELCAERIYILSLGSQQGNSHVHWHIAALPPGVPYDDQQYAALSPFVIKSDIVDEAGKQIVTAENRGYLKIPQGELSSLAARLGERMTTVRESHR
jgi:diadenosine tetraphosphate (Ap4A) HIT family hydrolase